MARIGFALTVANAALCEERMPGTGLVLHALDQYPLAWRTIAATVFGFPTPLAAELVIPGSPADRAGVRAGDGIVAAGALRFAATLPADARQGSATRDNAEAAITDLPPIAPIRFELIRDGRRLTVSIPPAPACRARFQLVPDDSWLMHSDGRTVQLAARYVERLDESELAVAVAHEFAHIVLHHRRRLAAAGVAPGRGLLREFGRGARLTRRAEEEADRLSVILLRNAGYDPASGPLFWRKWGGTLGGGPFRGASHASPGDRARMMEAEIAAVPASAPAIYVPPLLASRDQPLR